MQSINGSALDQVQLPACLISSDLTDVIKFPSNSNQSLFVERTGSYQWQIWYGLIGDVRPASSPQFLLLSDIDTEKPSGAVFPYSFHGSDSLILLVSQHTLGGGVWVSAYILDTICLDCQYTLSSFPFQCGLCPSNTYSKPQPSTTCSFCPSNRIYSPQAFSVSDCLCQAGYYTLDLSIHQQCLECKSGAFCPGGQDSGIHAQDGYLIDPGTDSVYKYIPESSCMGSITCDSHFKGDFCASCASGSFRLGLSCVECPSNMWVSIVFYVIGILFYPSLRWNMGLFICSNGVFLSFISDLFNYWGFLTWVPFPPLLSYYIFRLSILTLQYFIPSVEVLTFTPISLFHFFFQFFLLLVYFFIPYFPAGLFQTNGFI